MDYSKIKSLIVVLEGFVVLIVAHAIGGYYLAPELSEFCPQVPRLIIAMLATSASSSVVAIIYLAFRANFLPELSIRKMTFKFLFVGMAMASISVFVITLVLPAKISLAQKIITMPQSYFFLSLFLLLMWGPFIEEILCRGYFFEILRRNWGTVIAMLISSVLFTLPHGLWGTFSIAILFIFINSIIFTLSYIWGGLASSILVHIFVSSYMFYLNIRG